MMRYLRIFRVTLLNALQVELEYRINFAINLVNALLLLGSGLVIVAVMFSHTDSIGGWSFLEALALFGVFMMFEAFIELILHPNLDELPEYIRTGSLDHMLLKPVSGQFLVSTRHVGIWHLTLLAMGAGLTLYAMIALGTASLTNILLLVVFMAAGAAILYALWLMLSVTAFWFVKIDNISVPLYALFGAGRFPVTAFPPWARIVLTVVIPVAFITNVPAAAATERLSWTMALGSLALAALLLAVSRAVWRYAVAHYTSASS